MTTNTENSQGNLEVLASIVQRVFRIHDTTLGSEREGFLVRYLGKLLIDSEVAYEQIEKGLLPHNITPLFRLENDTETILLVKGVVRPKSSNPWVNAVLFALTMLIFI